MQKDIKGFAVVELVLAGAIFAVFSAVIVITIFQGSSATQSGVRAEIARQWAREGIEAVRAIRSRSFDDLSITEGSGVQWENEQWELGGNEDQWEGYHRVITIHLARRDNDGKIISAGGVEDSDLKIITSTVTKDNFFVEFSTYLSRREIIPSP